MKQIFYVTMDPERALGIEDLIPSYHILYSENSQLEDPISNYGIDIHHFAKIDKTLNTAKLLEDSRVREYIKQSSFNKPDVLVFKNDEQIEAAASKLNLNLLNSHSSIIKKLERDKIAFTRYISNLNLFKYTDFEEFDSLKSLNYQELKNKFGHSFVIQFPFGMSGSGTFFVDNELELKELQVKYPLRKGKITKKIIGPSYTINACITKLGIVIGGISEQITGIKALTSSLGGTVGNDYSQRHLNESLRRNLIDLTMKFGEVLRKEGHKGIFGLDLVLDEEKGEFYLIEANIRQVLSSGFTSYLQRDKKIVPIMLWHTLELLNHDFSQKFESLNDESEIWINDEINKFATSKFQLEYNITNNLPISASQVFFRNIFDYDLRIKEQFPSGIYRIRGRNPDESAELENEESYAASYKMREDGWSNLCFLNRGYNILQAKEEDGFLITSAPENSVIAPLGEIGRIQVLQSAFGSKESNQLNGWITDTIRTVYENMRFERNKNSE